MSRSFAGVLGTMLFLGFMANPLTAQVKPTVTSHDLAGKENCLMCHAIGVMPPVPDVPATHEGRASQSCQWCHAADSPLQTAVARATSHDLAGKENCLMCHAAGVMPPVPDVLANHKGFPNESCVMCHKPAGG